MITAESVYFYMFLVGFFFAVANLAISSVSQLIGGHSQDPGMDSSSIGEGELIGENSGLSALEDSSGMDFGEAGSFDGGTIDIGMDGSGTEFGGMDDFGGMDTGSSVDMDFGDYGATLDLGDTGSGTADISSNIPTMTQLQHLEGTFAHTDGPGTAMTESSGSAVDVHGHFDGFSFFQLYNTMSAFLPLRPTSIICFFAVAGGVGSIGIQLGWLRIMTHILAIGSGYLLSMLLGVLLPKKLAKAQNTSAAERRELIGLKARVVSAILENGYGRITYVVRENAHSAPAKHIDGKRVAQGATVVICKIHNSTFYVFTPEHLAFEEDTQTGQYKS